MFTIYVLKLEHDKYYIGKTKNLSNRINEHLNSNGSEWTSLHKPIKPNPLIIYFEGDAFEEDKKTKEWMSKYGIDNVRGGTYCQIVLDESTRKHLEKEILGAKDHCFKCGKSGHFANECDNHNNNNNTKKNVNNNDNDNDDDSSYEKKVNDYYRTNNINLDNDIYCSRCGRNSHTENMCYASRHINGTLLTQPVIMNPPICIII